MASRFGVQARSTSLYGGSKAPEAWSKKLAATANSQTTHVGGCQNYGPFLGPYYNAAPNI